MKNKSLILLIVYCFLLWTFAMDEWGLGQVFVFEYVIKNVLNARLLKISVAHIFTNTDNYIQSWF